MRPHQIWILKQVRFPLKANVFLNNSDEALHKALFDHTKDKTLLVITHRLENIREYDRVIVMEEGKIVEEGHYEELRKNETGFFGRIKRNI